MNGLEMRYFILKPKGDDVHAIASRNAMRAYASYIHFTNPQLAKELEDWADRETAATIEGIRDEQLPKIEQPPSRDEIIHAIAREIHDENIEPTGGFLDVYE